MEDMLKQTNMSRASKKVVHRATKDWNNKIFSELSKETEVDKLIADKGKKK